MDDVKEGIEITETVNSKRSFKPSYHMDSMLKETRSCHTRLSMMADRKAGMLITICSLAITILLPSMGGGRFQLPAIIIGIGALATIFLATYTVMPKGSAVRKKTAHKKAKLDFNPLFFGDFQIYSPDEYMERIHDVCESDDEIYNAVCMDIYYQGKFLAEKKYKFLRYAYVTFLSGLCCGGLAVVYTFAKSWGIG